MKETTCDYCEEIHQARDCVLSNGIEQILCSSDGMFGQCYVMTRQINYCPMCGKQVRVLE